MFQFNTVEEAAAALRRGDKLVLKLHFEYPAAVGHFLYLYSSRFGK